jgi:hypothetical protein
MANALRVGDHLLERLGADRTIDAQLRGGHRMRTVTKVAGAIGTGCWPASRARPR